jgi:hypothetical protein
MATSVPVTQRVRTLSFGLRLYALFALCTLLLFPLHESAHYLTYRLLGVHLHMTLNTASPRDQSQRKPIAELAGPLLNLVVASAGNAHDWNGLVHFGWVACCRLFFLLCIALRPGFEYSVGPRIADVQS